MIIRRFRRKVMADVVKYMMNLVVITEDHERPSSLVLKSQKRGSRRGGGSLCHMSILRKVHVPCYLIPHVTYRL